MLLIALGALFGWHWYWLPFAEVNPKHWAGTTITYSADRKEQTLWLHRRHAKMLSLDQAYLMLANDKAIPIRITAISYPRLFATSIRVNFELTNSADIEFVQNQRRVCLSPQQ